MGRKAVGRGRYGHLNLESLQKIGVSRTWQHSGASDTLQLGATTLLQLWFYTYVGEPLARTPIATWFFVLVVVRKAGKYLLVHERKHGQLWYLPAGRVEPGEAFIDAALRETMEEAGIAIAVDGIIRIEHSPVPGGARVRLVLTGYPTDDRPPKTVPDEESLEARWVTVSEAEQLPLRSPEVARWLKYVDSGDPVYPVSIIGQES